MKGAIITWIIWAVMISALLVITPINAVIQGENPVITGGQPKSWQELGKISISQTLKSMPYESNQTAGIIVDLTPWGYIKAIVNMFLRLTTFQVKTGDNYADALLYAFFYLPVGFTIIYRAFIIVRGGGD